MLLPTQIFKNPTTGTGNKITEVQNQNNINGEHGHKAQTRI